MKSIALVLAFAGSVLGADWPHYRGPAQDGSTKEELGTLAAKGIRERWNAKVGTGLSSMTVFGSRVFTAGYKNGKEILYCLDAATGKPLWTHAWNAKLGDYLFEGGPRATPTVDGQRVFMVGADGEVVCVDASNGKPIWNKDLVREFRARRMDWGFCASPTVDGDNVIIDAGGEGASTVALKKDSGALVWKNGDDEPGYGSVVIANVDGKRTAVVFKAAALVGHDAANGRILWSFPWETAWKVNAATPLLAGDLLVISSAYNHGAAGVRVKGGKPTQVWFNKKLKAHFNSPVHRDGFIYGIDGEVGKKSALVCLEARTGNEKWRAGGLKNGSLILTGDSKLLILTETGDLVAAEAAPGGYRELSRQKVLSGRCWVQPVFANGVIYCRNNGGELVALAR